MKRVTMELGGHAPAIVFDDADIDVAAKLLAGAKFRNAGQVCISPTRFLVQDSVYDRFVEGFVAQAKALKVADGLEAGTTMGPLANPRRITELRNLVGERYQLFTGVDDLLLECAILGIDGWVAGSGIGFPKENQRLWALTREGRWDEARELYRWAQPLMKLDTHLHFVQYIKLLCQETGLGKEWVREPRQPLAGEERERVLRIIREALAKRPA
jgi:dihydrodipicolinate synthase/N-acetylneuraminate lyase